MTHLPSEPEIRVGIITDGNPDICGAIVKNQLIGSGFHWQRAREAEMEGRFELLGEAEDGINLVNVLPVESYLKSVISSEMNPDSPIESLKAHAIISRSWAMRKQLRLDDALSEGKARHGNHVNTWEESDSHLQFDVCSDDHCQRYQGVGARLSPMAIEAVEATRGLVLCQQNGCVADARFSKCCGGRTEKFSTCWADKEYSYLQSVEDPWCNPESIDAEKLPGFLNRVLKDYDLPTTDYYRWHTTITRRAIATNLHKQHGIDIGEIREISVEKRGASGRAERLKIIGTTGEASIGKELAIRRLLSDSCLYSSWIEINETEKDSDAFLISGRGWGHGVGLCQIGAAAMALGGKDFREILSFYYPGTIIRALYE